MTLRITGLTKTYTNGARALNGVSLHIEPGMFGLLGENGAGKSTLLRVLATLLAPDSGSVDLDGIDVLADPAATRQVLGYLPQEFGVYPRTSAEVMLDHVAVLKGFSRKVERAALVADLLHKVNLYDVRARHLDGFSGGMKRRFGIAQALLGDPKLLIVDEPTAGLDPSERNRFHNLLSEIGETTTVILATHIVEDVRSLCTELAILGWGEVIVAGPPEAVMALYAGRIWRKRVTKAQARVLSGELRVISTQLLRGEMLVQVYSEHEPAPGFEPSPVTLEDAYFAALCDHRARLPAHSAGTRP